MKIQFLGATRQVTGSCYFLEAGGLRLLIDCGMFQERAHLGRNWEPLPVQPSSIDCVLLTHAHLDHSGLIPRLVAAGFGGSILTTGASRDVAKIILTDSARIQSEDARFKKKRHRREKRKSRYPVVPLYRSSDVTAAMNLFRDVAYGKSVRLNDHVSATFRDAGHILGSAMVELTVSEDGKQRTIVFSGDIGQNDKPIIRDPAMIERADYVVMESTYGGRHHAESGAVEDQLCDVINETVAAGGNLVVPTFAVERAQELVYYVGDLLAEDRIPHLMVFLDSPMAVNVTGVFRAHRECLDAEAMERVSGGKPLFRFPGLKLVRHSRESKAINRINGTCIIMAGSGMCTAGRIKHHLVKNVSRPESTILFCGYQANGTLGRQLVEGKPEVRIHGAQYDVRAKIRQVHGVSAHADHGDLLAWLGHLAQPPRRVFLTHGEESSANALATDIKARLGCAVEVPAYEATYDLD